MDAITALKTRRSVRVYLDKPISREIIEDIIDCARMSPTALNLQPWEFVVVTGKEDLRELADLTDHGKFIAGAAACVAVFCRDTKYYLEDGSAATYSILLAAWAHGLGSCWVAGDKKAYAGAVRELLGLPEDLRLVSLISIGYPAETPSVEKRPLSEFLGRNSRGP